MTNTSSWEVYPSDYRSNEIAVILRAVRAGDCAAVVGLSGSGKSNLLGFLSHRIHDTPAFFLVDCNRLGGDKTTDRLLNLIRQVLGDTSNTDNEYLCLEAAIRRRLSDLPGGLCILLDRFDVIEEDALYSIAGNLRSLRDTFKYRLTYVVAARRPVPDSTELAELFFGNTIWLGPLTRRDARWSAEQYAKRRGVHWDEATIQKLIDLSWGYPSMLRGVCEAVAEGAHIELNVLQEHPSIQWRVSEFYRDQPSEEMMMRCGLKDHPFLWKQNSDGIDTAQLTASEHRLFQYFQDHPNSICTKDELIQAVWSEEVFQDGIRDDSLAQLIRRLRLKIEEDPAEPVYIITVPGRGYTYTPGSD